MGFGVVYRRLVLACPALDKARWVGLGVVVVGVSGLGSGRCLCLVT